jgi:hypothetical protein
LSLECLRGAKKFSDRVHPKDPRGVFWWLAPSLAPMANMMPPASVYSRPKYHTPHWSCASLCSITKCSAFGHERGRDRSNSVAYWVRRAENGTIANLSAAPRQTTGFSKRADTRISAGHNRVKSHSSAIDNGNQIKEHTRLKNQWTFVGIGL